MIDICSQTDSIQMKDLQSITLLMSFRDYAPCCKLQSSMEWSKEKRGIDANQYSWKTMRDNDQ
jgi:hypothetical protein